MLFFYLVIVFSLLFVYWAEKLKSPVWMGVSALLLSLLCGLRNEGVGTDTPFYAETFEYIGNGGIHFDNDIGFMYLVRFIMYLTHSVPGSFTIIASITVCLFLFTLWKFRDDANLTYMFFLYICFFYPQTFNIIRQMLALSIVFAATPLILSKKYIYYSLVVLLSTTIHISCLICFMNLVVVVYFNIKKRKYKRMLLVLLGCLIVPVYGFFTVYFSRFEYMYDDYHSSLSFNTIIECIIVFLIFIQNKKTICSNRTYIIFTVLYTIGLGLTIITSNGGDAERIAYFFTVYKLIFAGVILNKLKLKQLGYFYYTFIALLYLLIRLPFTRWYGIMPYSSIFF